jgi:hypothetical protein
MPVNAFKRKRNLGFALSKRSRPELDTAKLRQRFPGTYARFGKEFLSNFPTTFYKGKKGTFVIDLKRTNWESPLQVSLITNAPIQVGKQHTHTEIEAFSIKLDFYKDTVKIVGIQGGENASGPIREFESLAGTPIANFLIQLIEEHAKKQRYKKIKIMKPETNIHMETVMPHQYHRVMSRTSRGRALVKKLKALQTIFEKGKKKIKMTREEVEEYKKLKEEAKQKIIESRKKLYTSTAKALNYTPTKNWFEKTLN